MIGKEYKWYLVFIRSKHEIRFNDSASDMKIETFLPLTRRTRKWSDRSKTLDVPLFPNYVFVKASNREYVTILEHPSVIGFVKKGPIPCVVSENLILSLRKILSEKLQFEIYPINLSAGKRIEIKTGPMAGCCGRIMKRVGGEAVVIEVDHLNMSVIVRADSLALC